MGTGKGAGGPLRGVTILVAEPDPVLSSTMLRFLEAEGAFPVEAARVSEAAAAAAGEGPRFDAAVIGSSLPDGCGLSLARALDVPAERTFLTTNFHFAPASEVRAGLVPEKVPLTMPGLVKALGDTLASRPLPPVLSR